jgi:hypothetical protein
MVTLLLALVLLAAVYLGVTRHLRSRPAFAFGVALTLGLWAAPFVLPSSYVNALYLILGVVGSTYFGLSGAMMWRRSRQAGDGAAWYWLAGSILVVAPVVLVMVHWATRRANP